MTTGRTPAAEPWQISLFHRSLKKKETMKALLEIAGDPQRLSELTRRIDEDAAKDEP